MNLAICPSSSEDMELNYENCFRLGLLSTRRGDFESARNAFSQGIQILEEMKDYQIAPSFEFVAGESRNFPPHYFLLRGNGQPGYGFAFFGRIETLAIFLPASMIGHCWARANISDDIKNDYIATLEKITPYLCRFAQTRRRSAAGCGCSALSGNISRDWMKFALR